MTIPYTAGYTGRFNRYRMDPRQHTGRLQTKVGTSPRVVGQAMAHNPTPLVIPCHRILAAHDIGGFSPSIDIKEALLAMEKKGLRKVEK